MPAYLKLDGYTGDATASKYTGQISVASYSWGFSVPVTTGGGAATGRTGAGTVIPQDLHFVKQMDATSGKFLVDAMQSKSINTAVLTLTKMAEGGEQEVMIYKMTNAITTSYSTGGSDSGGHLPTEQISLNFTKIEIKQFTYGSDNKATGGAVGGYDFKTNTKI